MKACVALGLALIFAVLFINPSFSQENFEIARARMVGQEYLPGDFVHVVVEAPLDTAQISAVMPDGKSIELVQERGTNVWHGLWQVPVNFKKGTYTSELRAVDLEGELFSGRTGTFVVGEIALITLARKGTPEAPVEKPLASAIIDEKTSLKIGEVIREEIKKIIAPSESLPTTLKIREKEKLVEQNLIAGKSEMVEGKFSEAAAYFRIALYLEPANKEANNYLLQAETRGKGQQAAGRRLNRIILLLVFFGLLLIGLAAYFGSKFLSSRPQAGPAPKEEKPLSFEEKQKIWLDKTGCKKHPFSPEAMQDVFIGDKSLKLESLKNFIMVRFEAQSGRLEAAFTEAALAKIHELSLGKPSNALKICDWSIKQVIGRNADIVTAEIIEEYAPIAFRKILIADDEEVVRVTLDGILRKGGGYETDFAVNGEEVLEKINKEVYGLVLLDIVMPLMDGYEVLKRIREKHPDLPVVFISGKGAADKVMESLSQYHLTGLIEKPFTMEKVLDTVANALSGRT